MADVIDAARTTFEDAGISVSLLAELESVSSSVPSTKNYRVRVLVAQNPPDDH